ncbi:hypothetical protein LX32DRAFT_13311 [Colletotrichum zoysiae]|uniref:Uncharacterized protein n=1 Tax=Colletotrichum zoysiae TaxID=1216348 RepID=A0AAD9HDB2_9PEZI|nr:hypothetical protein LX32DRAFT_13311 [Colletotrichum zoysiae]
MASSAKGGDGGRVLEKANNRQTASPPTPTPFGATQVSPETSSHRRERERERESSRPTGETQREGPCLGVCVCVFIVFTCEGAKGLSRRLTRVR